MKTILLAIAFLPCFTFAEDQAQTPGVDKRQEIQEQRIEQGVQSGELNEREAARMKRMQDRVEKAEDKAKSDGTVTREERRKLHKMQNHTSRAIHRQKHDRQKRR